MFQNVIEKQQSQNSRLNIFSNVFAIKNIVLYILSFMLSMVNLGGEYSVFSISMLGACFTSSVPLLRSYLNIINRKFNKVWCWRSVRVFFNIISISCKLIYI